MPEHNNEQEILGGFNDYDDGENDRFAFGYNNADFVAAANPQVVLALIARIEELEVNNYGPEILNDPQALTAAYFAGAMAEGRKQNVENDKLQAENDKLKAVLEMLNEEADWLARQLTKSEDIPCPEHPCVRTEHDGCFHCWRQAARKAVEKENETHKSQTDEAQGR